MTLRWTVAAVIATVLLGGCSAKPSAPTPERSAPATTAPVATTSETPPAPAQRSEHGGLSGCLQSHGVTDSGGSVVVMGPPEGVDPGTWSNAMKECSALGPGPGPG